MTGLCRVAVSVAMYSGPRTAAPDHPPTPLLPAVAIEGRDAHETGDLVPREGAELGQQRDEHARGDRADARHAAQQIILRPPERTALQRGGEIRVGLVDASLEPAHMLLHARADGPAGRVQAIPLSREHVDQLPPTGDQRDELLLCVVRQRPHIGADALRKEHQYGGIDRVRLGQASDRLRKGAHLPRIDDGDRHLRHGERRDYRGFVPAGGFRHDEGRRQRDQASHERRQTVGRLLHLPVLPRGPHTDVDVIFGNIESDKTGGHRSSITQRSVRTQPCVIRASRPGNCTGSDGANGRGAPAALRSRRPGTMRATASRRDGSRFARYKD